MRVGIIVPVHGWAPYLAESLDSVLSQQPAPDEVVVVDDGSPEPVALHVDHVASCRVVRRPSRGGLPAARRTGFEALRTEWVALCDADDVWRPGKLAAQVDVLRGGADACFAVAEVIGPDGRPTGERWPVPDVTLPALYERNPIAVSGFAGKREAVERAGGIARDMPAAEDWDLWLRLAASGASLAVAPDAVVAYRRRPGAMSGDVATLAEAQLAVHAKHAALVDEATRRRVEAAALSPLPPADRARAAALAMPGLRGAFGRRDPYRR